MTILALTTHAMGNDNAEPRFPPRAATVIDEACLVAAARGDEAAWDRIYREFAPTILGYLRSHGTPEAEDVLGEVFFDAARNLARFDGSPTGFRSWLFTIAHHRMVDQLRRASRAPRSDPIDEVSHDTEQGLLATPASAVDEHVEGRLLGAEVRALLDALAPDQRDVFLLVYVADMSLVDAARTLGKNVGAVKALHLRGLVSLRRAVARTAASLV